MVKSRSLSLHVITKGGARQTYGFRNLNAILALDFGFNRENGGFWLPFIYRESMYLQRNLWAV